MSSATRVGRTMGLLLLVQASTTPPIYFSMLPPVTARTFLTTAAPHSTTIRLALLLSLALSSTTLMVALTAFPVVRRRGERLAIAYVALSVVGLATMVAETLAFRNLLALSLEYARPAAPHDVLESIGAAAYSAALSAHFTNLLVGHTLMLLLYFTLGRLALVPRALAAAGVAASVIGAADVAQPLLGAHFSFLYVLPAGVCLLALIGWLLARGLVDHPQSRDGAMPLPSLAPNEI